jgi:hypothetical protein
MPDSALVRTNWVQPVLLALALAAAGFFAFLYFTRPNAELGSIRVVVADGDGKGSDTIHVFVAEAPLVQKETVSPGVAYSGTVHYPAPYLTKPNLKLSYGKRKYIVQAETPLGFTWVALPLADDFRENAKKNGDEIEKAWDLSLETIAKNFLKPGLIFEDFTWEAKGLRAPISALPPQTFEQKGHFQVVHGQQGVVNFPIPFRQAPNVQLDAGGLNKTAITDCTPGGFKWKNAGADDIFNNATVGWTATGVR